ncbi:NAD(P)-binding domain-containing protein [Variovorax sp. NFACC27]|uniref:NAD(P)-dependent oxidoreductase n=1 Tax=unclassified Variovorax TaxID=663243 RepID=UPI0008970177|nr:3-hydroxyisobutyrate dehydrogenase [Variovorax sp. NFACC28]SEG79213.1 3-hydroxyisobutyrate dehydrogenase [Variovorax sp. NFACC29]SFC93341.1 3-hydroxyisobutyrate dehydrogenase [Variovorax sp. NFACC26]SFG07098.1 3-hydroxyisobutyrate dehydrogenase [Variovorax sp. NFACC27]
MTDVSLIGLGPMGIALARALQPRYTLTLWNRTAGRAKPLLNQGTLLAADARSAVEASPIVLTCVADYAAARSILAMPGVAAALRGKVLVQLSTGTPQDAREAWAAADGVAYLDGALLATPGQIGRPDTPLFISGEERALAACRPVLETIAGNLMYMGEAIGNAAAWDLATLSCMFGAMSGFFHGARICESEGLGVGEFGRMIGAISPVLGEMIRAEGDAIEAGRYGEPESSMATCAGSGRLFVKQAREAKLDASFPDFLAGMFDRALAAGYANERLAAMVKVLR